MSDVMTAKLNEGFLMRPYSFFHGADGVRPSRSATMLLGWFSAFGTGEGLRIGYAALIEKLGLSRSTVARRIRELRKDGKIRTVRTGGQKSVYTYTGAAPEKAHVNTPLWLYDEVFSIDGIERKLTKAEVDIASLIYSHTRNDKSRCYIGSVREIAGILNLSEKTVMRAIPVLFAADIISRPVLGINRYKQSIFVANMKRFRREDKKARKEERKKERAQAPLPQAAIDANAKAERDKFYAARQVRMEKLADGFLAQAKRHPRFEANGKEIRLIGMELAKAEVQAPLTVPTLQARREELEAERARILDEQGVEEWQLDAKNHAICKICYDSGWQESDGRMCACYRCKS